MMNTYKQQTHITHTSKYDIQGILVVIMIIITIY